MTRPEFIKLCVSRGLARRTAEATWERWGASLARFTVAELDRGLRAGVIAVCFVRYLEEAVN